MEKKQVVLPILWPQLHIKWVKYHFFNFILGKKNQKYCLLFFFMYCRFSWTISIVQACSATKHMIISLVHTPPKPLPCMDYGNYPMFGNLCCDNGPLTCQSLLWTYNVSPQLIKKKLLFSAELILEPRSLGS